MQEIFDLGTVGVDHQSLTQKQLMQETSNSSILGAHAGNSFITEQLQVLRGLKA